MIYLRILTDSVLVYEGRTYLYSYTCKGSLFNRPTLAMSLSMVKILQDLNEDSNENRTGLKCLLT